MLMARRAASIASVQFTPSGTGFDSIQCDKSSFAVER